METTWSTPARVLVIVVILAAAVWIAVAAKKKTDQLDELSDL